MILYFSATGNSEYTAKYIASALNDNAVSIIDCMKNNIFSFSLRPNENLGLVFPTYAWGLPDIVCRFLKKVQFSSDKKPYVFFVATCGYTPGRCDFFANRYMSKKGFPLDASFSVRMPDTWTPIFNASDSRKNSVKNAAAEKRISDICRFLQSKAHGNFMQFKMPLVLSVILYYAAYSLIRRTAFLHVSDSCTGCGLCASKCPDKAIAMKSGKPVWIKNKCEICLGCLHRCPAFAIQYGFTTKKHGQYINPHTKI